MSWVPCRIDRVLTCLDNHISNEHHKEHYRTDYHPACLPEDVGLSASHEINVFAETKQTKGQKLKHYNLSCMSVCIEIQ